MASQPSRPSFDAVEAFKAMAVDPDDIVTKDYPNSDELRDMLCATPSSSTCVFHLHF